MLQTPPSLVSATVRRCYGATLGYTPAGQKPGTAQGAFRAGSEDPIFRDYGFWAFGVKASGPIPNAWDLTNRKNRA